ncbi:hypothetical protein CE91St36_03190 [Christensenellaceae bacterium]|nr:hypothetical protein CE91St36_03190 [Christensenellaceae bacterium]BDF60170.1 hypothetical protein CE91St37_03200 [Christensenellaceae bacterium]
MDIYNMSHCRDLTAAIAISRADRRKTVAFVVRGGSYCIGEVYRLEWKNGVLDIWKITKAEGRLNLRAQKISKKR